jgi:hypothetical protein
LSDVAKGRSAENGPCTFVSCVAEWLKRDHLLPLCGRIL